MSGEQRPGVRHVGAAGTQVLPDTAHGASGPPGRVLEATRLRRLGSQTGEKKPIFFRKTFLKDMSLFRGHWYPCFGLSLTSALGFKSGMDPLRACFVICIHSSDSPLYWPLKLTLSPAYSEFGYLEQTVRLHRDFFAPEIIDHNVKKFGSNDYPV